MPGNGFRYWRDQQLGVHGIDLLIATCDAHTYPRHEHDEYVIAVYTGGAQKYSVGAVEGVAVAGHLLVIPPGVAHSARAADGAHGWSHIALYPDRETLRSLVHDVPRLARTPLPVGAGTSFEAHETCYRLLRCHRILADEQSDALARQEAFAYAVLAAIKHVSGASLVLSEAPPLTRPIRRAIEYVEAHFSDRSLTIYRLAGAAGLSPYHFMRLFKNTIGLTAHGFVMNTRLKRAQALIADGATLADVAAATGFADQSHLTRHFRRVFGVTPGAYLQSTRRRDLRP
jgi:AraC-like DNA-binding protein